jgi:thiosulfate dehydrogenase [quinone] large subunit
MSLKDRPVAASTPTAHAISVAAPMLAEQPAGRRRQVAIALAVTRILVGWTFLWAFADKLFGLGYATPSAGSWLNGGSPTKGFLGKAAAGPFTGVYHSIAGQPWADWLFMAGLLGIGAALILGIGMRIAVISGVVLYLLMWTVILPPATNPIVDDHILGAAILVVLGLAGAGRVLGLSRVWGQTALVRKAPWLA